MKVSKLVSKILGYASMTALALLISIPIFWLVSGALKVNSEILTANPTLWPKEPTLNNFVRAVTERPFGSYFINSVITTLIGALAEVIMAITTAYALVFVRFPFRNAVFVLLLAALMVPEQIIIFPNYLTVANMTLFGLYPKGMLNTYAGIILPGASIAFGTFLLRQYFRTIPTDLVDAAKVDGAGHGLTLLNVVVPVAMPAIATSAMLSFTAKWNEYLWPLIVTTTDQMRTLPIAISRLLDAEGNTEWGIVMAATLIVIIPVIFVFLFAQRYIVEGIAAGAVKG
ncbi:MAG TPA: carbohydrate ABC transporter permease [Thermoflexales bacterium]|nr:carbohydrate ABC transporter permease [Thermoflexales bacterium]HQW36551.1 carbohydrate ABC transporter permease [Thermoflexales bacterium]HQX75356.1 carbohydrate ABC transporter permease [Thermoflexales bacterium]HQZ21554.1 carbohydrate ABC transporter permease [Thermoflexales bacterium]HQZ99067.1 carbohydrate ABC transporter permease [Thermoflexales bacterium]